MKCEELYEIFNENGITFFTGVPDSTFKDWMSYLADWHGKKLMNIVACNECEATSIASGYHLATNKIGVIYMQNSGLGKCVNPLTSLCDREVYSIPAILMVGWRGEPDKKDEPQHKKMGRIMMPLLDTLEIPYRILPNNLEQAREIIRHAKEISEKNKSPSAIIIKEGLLEKYIVKNEIEKKYEMSREDAIKTIVDNLSDEIIISTTGKTSRELFEYRVKRKEKTRDFYTVGSMGCSASIALGVALQKLDKKIFVFDGDGAVLMQMGALGTIGHYKPRNFYHILFDNNSHDSTGGQPTVSDTLDFVKIALSCGYSEANSVKTKGELEQEINKIKEKRGPSLLVIKVNKGARNNLGRPTTTPIENKNTFMKFLNDQL